jgi:NAD(P)-dependent dehydrogenase (short-subunit alcohol dehydrogenase family)
MEDLQGRVAVVAGAASGIGRGAAHALADAGALVVAADIDEAGALAVAGEIAVSGGRAAGVRCDVRDPDAFEALKALAFSQFGRVDIVMNNVGVLTRGRPEDLPVEEWARVLDTNLMSVIRSNAVFLPVLIAQGEGHIVNTASFAGLFTYAYDRLPYAASKAAVFQISEGLALYLRPLGVGVTCLCPGPVRTNIQNAVPSFSTELEVRGAGPGFEPLEPREVGDMVVGAIRSNTFFLPTHPQVRDFLVARAQDPDGFLQSRIDAPYVIPPAD